MLGIKTWKALKRRGVMGINRRNGDYVMSYNDRRLYPLVDDKARTKHLAQKADIRVPEQYALIHTERQVHRIEKILDGRSDFVIKPAQGAGGDGIMVLVDQFEGFYRSASGRMVSLDTLKFHLSGIISGLYSLGGQRDQALIEYRVRPTQLFDKISAGGVPDIRIIVLAGYPVLTMSRLPTRESDGKANLHQGAIGVGIDLETGVTLAGSWHNLKIDRHPDTLHPVAGMRVPDWRRCLEIAARCYEMTGLGYLGVDLVMDETKGPMMLELNARPGLNIQIANDAGLHYRCAVVEEHIAELQEKGEKEDVSARVDFIQKAFSRA